MQLRNSLAALPVGSLYHSVCLDNLTDAFQGGACNMASSLAALLHSVGFEMPRIHDVVPLSDVDGVVKALTACQQGRVLAVCIVQPAGPTQGVVSCACEQWCSLIAHVGGIVSFLFLGGACSAFCNLDWVVMACLLMLAVWLVLAM